MKFTKTTLKNGLRLITVPSNDNPSTTVLVLVEAGSKYERKEESGISHFLEHMVFKGTTKRPQATLISRELDSIGAQHNAFTSYEYTGYYAKVAHEHSALALDIISDMYVDPLLDAGEIEKERGVIIEEMRMYQDMPQSHVQDMFMSLMYGDQPAGWNVIGNEQTLRSFKREDIADYRRRHYVSEATIVIVSGSFDEAKIAEQVEAAFAKITSGPKAPKIKVIESQEKPAISITFKETDQTHFVLGVRAFDTLSPESPSLKVLSTLLGRGMSSRLFVKLRDEMGVCYYVGADYDSYTDSGLFSVSAGVDNARVAEVIKVILSEFKKIMTEDIPPAELQKAKDYLIGGTTLHLETSDAQGQFFGMQEAVKGKVRSLDEVAAEIRAVTADEVRRVAERIFVEKHLNLALIGRFNDEKIFDDILKI